MSVRTISPRGWETADRYRHDITCGNPDDVEMQDYNDNNIQFVVSLDKQCKPSQLHQATISSIPYTSGCISDEGPLRIVKHMPNPFRGTGKPIDMSVVDEEQVLEIANIIVALSLVGGVYFHCRAGKDRTGLVEAGGRRLLRSITNTDNGEDALPFSKRWLVDDIEKYGYVRIYALDD